MNPDFLLCDNLIDPVARAFMRNGCSMRTYQSEALREIFDAVESGKGGSYTVTFPRQSGKNETQAQLESAVMAANLFRGGNIIKVLPTLKNQGRISFERLCSVLRPDPVVSGQGSAVRDQVSGVSETGNGPEADFRSQPAAGHRPQAPKSAFHDPSPAASRKPQTANNEVRYGNTRVRCVSASPNAAIVGETADLMLEVDEAQLVRPVKFDTEAAPMAASVNAVRVFWGTVWDDRTLLARETRSARMQEEESGRKHVFHTTAAEVGREVPAYGSFVRGEIERFGREHPAVRTQFFCEEISDLTAMFTPARIEKMKGKHEPQERPETEHCYVFLIDIAGSDETTPAGRRANGFSDRRDATVLTICDVRLPEDKLYTPKNFVWNVVARRLYRNLPAARLEQELCREVECWDPRKIILDHSGLGSMISGVLSAKWPFKCRPVDITARNKTKMAWDFLAMVETGRWVEYRSDEMAVMPSGFRPGKEPYEILRDPALLQQMFFRELRACQIEPLSTAMTVRWGVPDGTRDLLSGRLVHDDLVMSAAMAVFEEGDLPIGFSFSEGHEPPVPVPFWPPPRW